MLLDSTQKRTGVLLAAVFFVTLAYSFYHRIEPVVDAAAYDTIAQNILAGHGFKEEPEKSFATDYAIMRAGPAYEFFLAGVYALFGHRYEVVWILQALLHTLTALLLYGIARALWREHGETAGLAVLMLFGFHPDLIEIAAMLLTETLYLFFIALTLWCFVKIVEQPRAAWWHLGFGAVAALAIFTRPPVALFVPVFLYYYFRERQFRALFLFSGALALTLLPWVLRNYVIYHQVILTTLIGEYNLWAGNTLFSTGGQTTGGYNPVNEYLATHDVVTFKAAVSEAFWSFVFGHPLAFFKLCIIRFIRFFSLIRPMGFWFYQSGLPQALLVASSSIAIAVLFVSGFAGMLAAWRERSRLWSLLIILALTAPLVLIPTVVQSRYRFQIYPFLALFGAYAIARLWRERSSLVKKDVFWVAGGLLGISLLDGILSGGTIIARLTRLFGL